MTEFVPTPFNFVDPIALKRTIIVRWTGPVLPSDVATYIQHQGYNFAKDSENLSPIGWYDDDDKVMLLELETMEGAHRIEQAAEMNDFEVALTKLKIQKLIGMEGVRLKDSMDLLKCNQHNMSDMDILNFVMELLAVYSRGKDELAQSVIGLIKQMLEIMFYKPQVHLFGSYASPLRRQGSSDIDMTFWFPKPTPADITDPNMQSARSKQDLRRDLEKFAHDPENFVKRINRHEMQDINEGNALKTLYLAFHRIRTFHEDFRMFYITTSKVPMLVIRHKVSPFLKIDLSLNNKEGYDKARLIELFMTKDSSKDQKMRKCMIFFVHWARCNNLLPGSYADESLSRNGGFNSYIFNHLIMHFVQEHRKGKLVQPNMNPDLRVLRYNFDNIFSSVAVFFRELFKHLASIDFNSKAIYNDKVMNKYNLVEIPSILAVLNSRETVIKCHGMLSSPLVVLDPLEPVDNIAKRVTQEDMKRLNQLTRNALLILKQKDVNVSALLETNKNATIIMSNVSWSLQHLPGTPPNTMVFELPEVIQTSNEFFILLNKILRFDQSCDHEGTSSTNLLAESGVTFVVYGKAWVGRRNKRRRLKNCNPTTSNLKIELEVSKSFEFTYDEPIATVRVLMAEMDTGRPNRKATVQVLQGSMSDMHDAFHYLVDQFLVNNLNELIDLGIVELAAM